VLSIASPGLRLGMAREYAAALFLVLGTLGLVATCGSDQAAVS